MYQRKVDNQALDLALLAQKCSQLLAKDCSIAWKERNSYCEGLSEAIQIKKTIASNNKTKINACLPKKSVPCNCTIETLPITDNRKSR